MGDGAERIVYGDQYVIVSSVVPSRLIQRVNREKLLFSCGSIAGSNWSSTAATSPRMPGSSPIASWTRRSV